MSDEKTEDPWKTALRGSLEEALDSFLEDRAEGVLDAEATDAVMAAVMPHMESSYKVGRMKATARIGRRYVLKNLVLARKLRLVREALTGWRDSDRLTVEILGDLEQILDNEDIAPEAEAEIRKKALREAAGAVREASDPLAVFRSEDMQVRAGYGRRMAELLEEMAGS